MTGTPPTPGDVLEGRVGPHDAVAQATPGRYLRVDTTGRWLLAHVGGSFAHRTMDGLVVRKTAAGAGRLAPAEARAVHEAVPALARELAALARELPREQVQLARGTPEELADRLLATEAWTPERLAGEADRFAAAYPQPVAVLPPDRYRDVVVQPATGCPNGLCTFCTLYTEPDFRPLTLDRFRAHVGAVKELLGPLLHQRDGVFLGSASALSLSHRSLLPVLEEVERSLGRRKRGVASFLDPDRAPRRSPEQWRAAADAGLTVAVLGLETGAAALRRELGKSAKLDHVAAVSEAIGGGGVARAFTVLAGPGGAARADEHLDGTAAFLASLDLERTDRIYLSPLRGSLPSDDLVRETARLREALKGATSARVIPYQLERFRYYA